VYSNQGEYKFLSVALIVSGKSLPLVGPVPIEDAQDKAVEPSVAVPDVAADGDARIVALFSKEAVSPADVRVDSTLGQVRVLNTRLQSGVPAQTMERERLGSPSEPSDRRGAPQGQDVQEEGRDPEAPKGTP
jgi:hypothetical protein